MIRIFFFFLSFLLFRYMVYVNCGPPNKTSWLCHWQEEGKNFGDFNAERKESYGADKRQPWKSRNLLFNVMNRLGCSQEALKFLYSSVCLLLKLHFSFGNVTFYIFISDILKDY